MSGPISYPKFAAVDLSGNPLALGKVYSYEPGTLTEKSTFSDSDFTIPHTNPIVLDERGECILFVNGDADLFLFDKDGNQIWGPIRVGETAGPTDIAADTTITADLTLNPGDTYNIANGVTLTINGVLTAGAYQIFNCIGTGAVVFGPGAVRVAYPEWFGAVGDGTTDDTAALTACSNAIVAGGTISLGRSCFKTTGWLITKDVGLVSDAPHSFDSDLEAATLKAAGTQDYVLKLLGIGGGGAGDFIRPYVRNITISGASQTINDAALVMDACHLGMLYNLTVKSVQGHGVRCRTCWETRFLNPFILDCGTINTGSAFYIDGPTPYDGTRVTNNFGIVGGIWSSNRGRWIEVDSLANLDTLWLTHNKFELDNSTTPNTLNTNVLHFGSMARAIITFNTFAGFGLSSDKYENLIYVSGNPSAGVYGSPGNFVFGNRAQGYPINGAINGLYLDTNAPTVEEHDNIFISTDGSTCPNVNVSTYPQLINAAWKGYSSSLYPLNPLPDQELPGFLSIHRVARVTANRPFVVDPNSYTVINNAGTVLQLDTAESGGGGPGICMRLDLSRYIGHTATNLVVRVRMRLFGAGSVTVTVNPSYPAWHGVNGTVNTTTWKWYDFSCPITTIIEAEHLMDVFLWSIDVGTPKLLVDGFEFGLS